MSFFKNTVQKNRLLAKLSTFFKVTTRTNAGLSERPVSMVLETKFFPSPKIFIWSAQNIHNCCLNSGLMNKIKNLTPLLRITDIEKHIYRSTIGSFLYLLNRLTNSGSSFDPYEIRENFKRLSNDKSIKTLTGIQYLIELACLTQTVLDVFIPTIFGTGNVRNKRDQFAARLTIRNQMSNKVLEFINFIQSDEKTSKYFKGLDTLNKYTRSEFNQDFLFMENLQKSSLLSSFGTLEWSSIQYIESDFKDYPILSYFGIRLHRTSKLYEYTLNDDGLNIYTIAACQISNMIPSSMSIFGCSNIPIDLDWFRKFDFSINAQNFSNLILPKLFIIDELDHSSLKDSKKDQYSIDPEPDYDTIPYLNKVHIQTIVCLFTGLSLNSDLNGSSFSGPGGGYNPDSKGPKPKGSSPKSGSPSEPSDKNKSDLSDQSDLPKDPDSPSTDSNFQVVTPDAFSQPIDQSETLSIKQINVDKGGNKIFGLFRTIGGLAVEAVKITAPNVGLALNTSQALLNMYTSNKPKVIIDSRSLIGQVHNEFSLVPRVPKMLKSK